MQNSKSDIDTRIKIIENKIQKIKQSNTSQNNLHKNTSQKKFSKLRDSLKLLSNELDTSDRFSFIDESEKTKHEKRKKHLIFLKKELQNIEKTYIKNSFQNNLSSPYDGNQELSNIESEKEMTINTMKNSLKRLSIKSKEIGSDLIKQTQLLSEFNLEMAETNQQMSDLDKKLIQIVGTTDRNILGSFLFIVMAIIIMFWSLLFK